ncbi:MAG TPA: lysophospholipid acyltransferase family protein [Candidatus Limnocylindrales bacterium]|nr:lysophospholipid acyltransferase family protein [Candidatus Limnocylindrales bacterium]
MKVAQADEATEAEPELAAGLHGPATAEPGRTYRILRRCWRAAARALRLRFEVEGLQHLPRDASGAPTGGWIAAGMPHRTWIDPFVPWMLLPARPRLTFFGDARTMARSPLRRWVMARLGGVIPIPAAHDPRAVPVHLAAAEAVLRNGGVFCLFPETGPATPPGTIRRLGSGIGYVAIRNGAPIVPIVLGGTHELYLGRKILLRVLPAIDPRDLAGLVPGEAPPPPDSPAEKAAVHRLLAGLAETVAGPVLEAHERVEPPPGSRKPLARRLTGAFR